MLRSMVRAYTNDSDVLRLTPSHDTTSRPRSPIQEREIWTDKRMET
jgi:hypothetical protein